MNWSYLAGLFDGEGSVAIALDYKTKYHGTTVKNLLSFSSNDKTLVLALKKFFKSNDISYRTSNSKNPLGDSKRISIGTLSGVSMLVDNLLPLTISKRQQLIIMRDCLQYKTKLKRNGEFIVNHLDEFDEMRHKLHRLAVKGPLHLKAWTSKSLNTTATKK